MRETNFYKLSTELINVSIEVAASCEQADVIQDSWGNSFVALSCLKCNRVVGREYLATMKKYDLYLYVWGWI